MRKELECRIQEEFAFMRRKELSEKDAGTREARKAYTPYELYGCQFDDGWYEILRSMLLEIEKVYADKELCVDIVPYQLRQKCGRMSFAYCNELDEGIRGQINRIIRRDYRAISETICEMCGKPAELRTGNMPIRSLCEECKRR